MATLQITRPPNEVERLLRFVAVGGSGTVIDFLILTIGKEFFLLTTLLANTLGFCAGLVNNFTWNRAWTFADRRSDNVSKQFMQFFVVSFIGLTLNNLIVWSLESPLDGLFGSAGYGYIPAKVFATIIVVFWNFNANRMWTFKAQEEETVTC